MDDFYWMDQNEASSPWRPTSARLDFSEPSSDQIFTTPEHLQSFVRTPNINTFAASAQDPGSYCSHSITSSNDLLSYGRPTNPDLWDPTGGLLYDHADLLSTNYFGFIEMPDQLDKNIIGAPEEQADSIDEVSLDNLESNVIEGSEQGHLAVKQSFFKCAFCGFGTADQTSFRNHLRTHGYTCHECKIPFASHYHISEHAQETGHNAYQCTECDATFSRLDVLGRHRQDHGSVIKKYSCTHCKKWRAPNGFTRKDHLTQHLRNYHHLQIDTRRPNAGYSFGSTDPGFYKYCLHQGCSLFREDLEETQSWDFQPLFASRSAFTAHMKKEHDESIFPCTHTGCSRINGKGFFRKRDLMKHMRKEHVIYGASNDDEAIIPQAGAVQQEISPGPVSTSSEVSAVASAQEESQSHSSIDTDTTGDVEAALKVLRSKGYLIEKDPNFSGVSTK